MTRRSLRIEEKQKSNEQTLESLKRTNAVNAEDESQGGGGELEKAKRGSGSKRKRLAGDTGLKSSRKRVKKEFVPPESTRRVRGKRGLLERLVKDTPLDIVLEIFKHLLPLDILNLSRTSKELRAMLMSQSSVPIWRTARENVPELPPLPSDLNEAQYANLAFDSYCHALRVEYMEVKDHPEDLRVWCNRRREIFRELRIHSSKCEDWHESWLMKRMAEQGDIRRQRRIEITRRMTALGWEGKDLGREFADHHLVDQPKPLTDRSWNIIKPILLEFLEEHKLRRIKLEREMLYANRHRLVQRILEIHCQKNPRKLFPPIGDFVLASDGINKLLWSDPDQEVPESEFIKVLCTEMPHIAEAWIQKKEKELLKRVPEDGFPAFTCTKCREVLWIPRVFVHNCCTYYSASPVSASRDIGKKREVEFNPFVSLSWRLWSSKCIEYDPRVAGYVKTMLELSGARDLEGLDTLDPLFECLDCGLGTVGRLFLRWSTVITAHPISGHRLSVTSFDDDLKERVMGLHMHPREPSHFVYLCRHCDHPPVSSIRTHLKEKHNIPESQIRSGDWGWKVDMGLVGRHPPPVVLTAHGKLVT
uniref:F-box domain-containing protein n=1 Tax=Moniliophthora roreri TaxID=221103 RepID=A0A0W0F6C9_MONRR